MSLVIVSELNLCVYSRASEEEVKKTKTLLDQC